jgi:hypothetical protein
VGGYFGLILTMALCRPLSWRMFCFRVFLLSALFDISVSLNGPVAEWTT